MQRRGLVLTVVLVLAAAMLSTSLAPEQQFTGRVVASGWDSGAPSMNPDSRVGNAITGIVIGEWVAGPQGRESGPANTKTLEFYDMGYNRHGRITGSVVYVPHNPRGDLTESPTLGANLGPNFKGLGFVTGNVVYNQQGNDGPVQLANDWYTGDHITGVVVGSWTEGETGWYSGPATSDTLEFYEIGYNRHGYITGAVTFRDDIGGAIGSITGPATSDTLEFYEIGTNMYT